MMTMVGLDSYSATKHSVVGTDWLNLTSGALKSAGATAGSLASGKTATPATPDDAAKKAAADKKAAAAAPMATWKKAGIALVLGLGGWYAWRHFHHKK